MFWWVGHMPTSWEAVVRMAVRGLTLIDKLERKKITCQCATENCCHLALLVSSTCLVLCFFIVHCVHGTIFISVWSQFMISSGGMSSTTSCRKFAFISLKLASVYLLVAVVAFLWTNFIRPGANEPSACWATLDLGIQQALYDHTLKGYL